MERIPAEVWGIVFGNLENSRDLQNTYGTCQLWRDVLQSSKASWMFGLVFPQVERYLPPTEALKCRTICKHWLHGVNNYLENSSYFRPTFEEPGSPGNNGFKTDEYLEEGRYPSSIFCNVVEHCHHQRDDMIRQVSNYSNALPLVGKWFRIDLWTGQLLAQFQKEFLDSFGSHIWFLHIHIRGNPRVLEVLRILLKYLPLFPNLKRLDLEFYMTSPLSNNEISEQLNNYLKTHPANKRIKKLPKFLETLIFDQVYGIGDRELKKILLELLLTSAAKNLQSLVLTEMSNVASLEAGNIVDLSVTLTCYDAVHQALKIQSPVRRLKLACHYSAVLPHAMFRIVKHFRKTLRNLLVEINHCDPEFDERDEESMDSHCFILEPLTNRRILKNLKNVKRMTVQGTCLLSLNFLCGLRHNLEYLHILMPFETEDDKILAAYRQRMEFTEKLDLLAGLRQFVETEDSGIIYKSNIWKVFPKLRELTVNLPFDQGYVWDAETFGFRRDVYDKLVDNR